MAGLDAPDPAAILGMWAAGVAGAAAVVSLWRIVGAGFIRLAAGVGLLLGGAAWLAGGGVAAGIGLVALAASLAVARQSAAAAAGLGIAAALHLLAAAWAAGWVLSATGAVALGGVTSEMLLGHWYLVDPRLPRWALKRLGLTAALGVTADALTLAVLGAFAWTGGELVVGWAYVALAAVTLVLLTGVWFSLDQPFYSGVMAATGLSYLAVLTTIGATVAGRALAEAGSGTLVPG